MHPSKKFEGCFFSPPLPLEPLTNLWTCSSSFAWYFTLFYFGLNVIIYYFHFSLFPGSLNWIVPALKDWFQIPASRFFFYGYWWIIPASVYYLKCCCYHPTARHSDSTHPKALLNCFAFAINAILYINAHVREHTGKCIVNLISFN